MFCKPRFTYDSRRVRDLNIFELTQKEGKKEENGNAFRQLSDVPRDIPSTEPSQIETEKYVLLLKTVS